MMYLLFVVKKQLCLHFFGNSLATQSKKSIIFATKSNKGQTIWQQKKR